MAPAKRRVVSVKALVGQRNLLVALTNALTQQQAGGVLGVGIGALTHALPLCGALAYRHEGDALELAADHGLPQKCKAWLARLATDDEAPWFVAQRVAQSLRAEVDTELAEARVGLSIAPHLREAGWGALVAAPVVMGRELLGVMVLAAESEGTFDTEVVRTIEAACGIMALAMMRERFAELEGERLEDDATAQLATIGLVASSVADDLGTPLESLDLVVQSQDALVRSLREGLSGVSYELDELEQLTYEAGAISRRIRDIGLRLHSVSDDSDPITLDLARLVRSAVALMYHHITGLGVAIELEETDEILSVDGRDAALRLLVVQLLLHSAREIHASGTGEPSIVVTCYGEGGRCILTIQSGGQSEPSPDSGASLFAAWMARARSDPKDAPGLVLARQTVLAHGGHIEVSMVGLGGTKILVHLPASDSSIRPEEQRPSFPMPTLRPPQGATPVVLWIDDDEVTAATVQRALQGFDVRVATSVEQGQELLGALAEPPEMVFCTVELPDGYGIELHHDTIPETAARFVFMSGGVIPADVGDYLRASNVTTLIKPLSLEEITNVLAGRTGSDDAESAATTLQPDRSSNPPPG